MIIQSVLEPPSIPPLVGLDMMDDENHEVIAELLAQILKPVWDLLEVL